MEFQEVILARALRHDLEAALSPAGPAEVSIRECGANSSCTARRGERSCRVNCFHYDMRDRHGPEYQVCFFRGERMESSGRTPADADAVRSVCDWLSGAGVEVLHDRYAFVDRHRRMLTNVESAVLAASSELRRLVAHELRDGGWDDCELTFARSDRSCNLSFYGDNTNAVFRWDQAPMFAFPATDVSMLADVLRRWLCDGVAPSAIREEYPAIGLNPVAAYYEAGRPVEGEFILSWDGIERFYREMEFPVSTAALRLIARMREHGYDRKLRAGQSLWFLGLSRSRRHGLRDGQPRIWFTWKGGGMEVVAQLGEVTKLRVAKVELTPEVEALLQRLAEMPID